jgi:glutamate-1-semialdehyde 2,1-aminomutase
MPGRQSNARALPEPSLFIDRGYGARFLDVDGREFFDFGIAMGPGIWGHGNREYLDAIHAQLERLYYVQSGALQTTLEVQLAEAIVRHVPGAERVRFLLSGSEAVQMALRLARAHTGRPKFVRFAGHYHGWLDNVLGGVLNPDPDAEPFAVESPNDPFRTAGRASGAFAESYMLPWNDVEALERVLTARSNDIAVVLMEAINSNGGGCPPHPGYLEAAHELCKKYGVLLCFDEIITGFRTALGGAQSILGVTPDLSIFGKALAGGMPLAAVGGRADIFELLRLNRVVAAGTFNAFPVGMASALKSIEMLERDDGAVYRQRAAIQQRLCEGLRQAAQRHGHALMTQGPPGAFCTHFTDREVLWSSGELLHADAAKATRFRGLLREEGVIQGLGGRWMMSFALTPADAEEVLVRAGRALARL